MTRKFLLATSLFALMMGAGSAQAAPCAGFTDVDSTSPFCPNVEWLKNRSITTGCTSTTLYCPTDPVSRLAMAAFMQRLGDALLPATLYQTSFISGGVDIDLAGPTGLSNSLNVCTTGDLAAATYPRRVLVDINTNANALTAVQGVLQRLAISTNAGANWTLVNAGYFNKVSNVAVSAYYSLTSHYLVDIPAGQVTRFAANLTRYDSSVVAGNDFNDLDCSIRRLITSRTGAASPFDEDIQESPVRN